MKITIVLGAFFPVPPIMGGAVEKVWFALGQEFAKRGHEVVQISRAHPDLPRRETIADVKHLRVSGFAQPPSRAWLKLLDLIYSLRVRLLLPRADILVTNTFWLPMLVRSFAPGLLYIHVQRGPKGQMRFYGHAARLLAVSQAIANAIVTEAPQLRDKMRVIPNAVPQIATAAAASRERTVLFVGRVHPEKGLELLLGAWRRLPEEIVTNWRLKIIGPAEAHLGGGGEDFLARLQTLARGSTGGVEWVGPLFDELALASQYAAARFFVYPSLAETGEALPVAPLEAMANGCIPVVSVLACFRDYIEDDVTGFSFNHRVDGEAALAQQLEKLLSMSEPEWTRLSAAAQRKASEFAADVIAERYLADFESLLAASGSTVQSAPTYAATPRAR